MDRDKMIEAMERAANIPMDDAQAALEAHESYLEQAGFVVVRADFQTALEKGEAVIDKDGLAVREYLEKSDGANPLLFGKRGA